MSRIIIFDGDSLKIRVPVTNPDGSAKNMTGATIQGFASSGGTKVDAALASFTDISGGIASVFFAKGDLTAGKWTVEAEFILGSEVQTFATVVIVNPSAGP